MRTSILILALACAATAQFTVTDPNLTSAIVAAGLPGARHQLGTDGTGSIYVAEEIPGGWTGSAIHRIDAAGVLTTNWITQSCMSIGQMVRNPGDGRCYLVNHWQGALEHNHLDRIEPAGTLTLLDDVLWGEGHGFALDAAGNWYVGTTGTFQPRQIYRIPAGQLGYGAHALWASGPGQNAWLARAEPGALLCADGPSVWRVQAGVPDVPVYSHLPPGGASFTWRGIVANPFGAGHVVSVIQVLPGGPVATGRVLWIGSGGPREMATWLGPLPGDLAIAGDDAGGLLVVADGAVHRLTAISPPPTPPGQLGAPSAHPVSQPFTVTLSGRIYALTPFVLAVDLPLGPPVFPQGVFPIPPFGLAHTSLGVLPTFLAVRDGIGAFRPAEPASIIGAGGTFSETYALPAAIAGTTVVIQGYVLDAQAPNGMLWITAPVFTVFS